MQQEIFRFWIGNLCERATPRFDRIPHLVSLHKAKHSGLDAAEREVILPLWIVGGPSTLLVRFDLRARHRNRVRISMLRQLLNNWPARITQREKLCNFVEGFARCVV